MISERLLLEGAWYALEQCGTLLRDAVTLYERGSLSTAVGLALLAREELGKTRILLDFWREAVNKGRTVSAAEIRRKLDDHEEKQRKGQMGQTLRAAGGTQAAKLLQTYHRASDPSERAAAWRELEQLSEKVRKRTPADRHMARMRAFYVDLNKSGTGWSRPTEMPGDARAYLEDAANDYALQWDRLQGSLEILAHVEPKLASALEQWRERPALPVPARPKFL